MKKITELTEERWRTVYTRDEYGNRYSHTEDYYALRPVKTVLSGPRFGHYIIDGICFQIITYVGSFLFGIIGAIMPYAFLQGYLSLVGGIFFLLAYPGLYAFCEWQWQRTPGKYFTDTWVIDEYGNKPEFKAIVFRSLLRLVPFEGFSCWGDKYSYGWHDRWTKTWVVTEEELMEIKKLQLEQSEDLASSI